MTRTYEEAVAAVTAPGQMFEISDLEVGGVAYRAFTNAPATLRDVFDGARAFGDRTFLVYEGERWTFEAVMADVDALAAALVHRFGVAKGDRVAIAMRNLPEWIVAYGAALSVGAVVVSLNAWWTEEELDYALNDSTPRVVVADPERAARTAGAVRRLGASLVVARAGEAAVPEGADRYEGVLDRDRPRPEVELGPDDDATILYTSGTTGRPKGAVSTHRAVGQALTAFGCGAAVEGARRGSAGRTGRLPVFILIVPLFHVTGAIPVMLSCVAVGLRLVMMRRWDPEVALGLIETERVTNLIGVPTQSWDLLESPHFADYDTSSLRSVAGGGAPAPPALVRRVESSFSSGRPTIGYGMTETNAYGPANHGDDYLTHPTSAGRALPIVDIEIRDDTGRARPTGESGAIWMKGPHIIRGYWNKPQETAEALVEGWLATGDVGRVDAEGFIYVEDRAKDMVLRGGENVYCAEVEAALYEHPAVNEAAVFGRPHPRLGEEVVAVVVVRPSRTATEAELIEHLATRLAAYKVPAHITVTDQRLPRSPTGKILKRQLRAEG